MLLYCRVKFGGGFAPLRLKKPADYGREKEAVEVWTQLIRTQNQPLEALMQFTELLVQHNLRSLAFSALALDRVAQQTDKPESVYRHGVFLIDMGELERARLQFERVLQIPKPQAAIHAKSIVQRFLPVQDPLWHVRHIAHSIGQRMDGHGGVVYLNSSRGIWFPPSYGETQIAALAQLVRIASQREELQELIVVDGYCGSR